jgi:hypothetical protein
LAQAIGAMIGAGQDRMIGAGDWRNDWRGSGSKKTIDPLRGTL